MGCNRFLFGKNRSLAVMGLSFDFVCATGIENVPFLRLFYLMITYAIIIYNTNYLCVQKGYREI